MVIEDTNINLYGLIFILFMGLLILVLPRRFAVLPLIASACFITLGQQVVVISLHFQSLRIIILFGWVRIFFRREFSSVKLNTIDKLIIIYVCVGFLVCYILWQTSEALINRLGISFDVIGIYFLCRFLIRNLEDIERAIKIIALLSIPLAGFMISEQLTGKNIFSVFGGVTEVSEWRDGRFRARGAFRIAITAGCFGATSMPLLIGLWASSKNRKLWLMLGIVANALITIVSFSSGAILAYGFGLIGLLGWIWRRYMRLIRWGILIALVLLHLIMKDPVWFLFDRIAKYTGGAGWHRSFLIDQAIRHLNEWWLIGTRYTAHWFPYVLAVNPDMSDITNQFISEGITGGLLKMFLFIFIIVTCFKTAGQNLGELGWTAQLPPFQVWSFGVCLLVHIAAFLSITYFDQMIVFWYMLLAFFAVLRSQNQPADQLA